MGVGAAQRPSACANTKLCRTRPMELMSPPLLVLGWALATPKFRGRRPARRRETRPDVGWGLGWPNAHLTQRPKPRYTMSRGAPTWHAAHSPGDNLPRARRSSRHSEARESQHPFLTKVRHRGDPAVNPTPIQPDAQRPAPVKPCCLPRGGGPAAGLAQPASPQLTGSLRPQRPSAQRPSAASRRSACPRHRGDPAVRLAWPPDARIEGRPPSIANQLPIDPRRPPL